MRILACLSAFVFLGMKSPEFPTPSKDGYAIFPASWGYIQCDDEKLQYELKGTEARLTLPAKIRQALQKEYELVSEPSQSAAIADLNKIFGPLNIIPEKDHTLWVIPVHRGKTGHAIVFVKEDDGSFMEGLFRIGLNGK